MLNARQLAGLATLALAIECGVSVGNQGKYCCAADSPVFQMSDVAVIEKSFRALDTSANNEFQFDEEKVSVDQQLLSYVGVKCLLPIRVVTVRKDAVYCLFQSQVVTIVVNERRGIPDSVRKRISFDPHDGTIAVLPVGDVVTKEVAKDLHSYTDTLMLTGRIAGASAGIDGVELSVADAQVVAKVSMKHLDDGPQGAEPAPLMGEAYRRAFPLLSASAIASRPTGRVSIRVGGASPAAPGTAREPSDVSIEKSSGDESLDRAAIQCVKGWKSFLHSGRSALIDFTFTPL